MSSKTDVLVIHGPNLHLLGKREPSLYGTFSLEDIDSRLRDAAAKKGLTISTMQSNSESEIVERITRDDYTYLIINPAAYTHTSVAIRDAILGVDKPAIEVHISNIYKREEFRRKSLISDVVRGVISGFGPQSYLLALESLPLPSGE